MSYFHSLCGIAKELGTDDHQEYSVEHIFMGFTLWLAGLHALGEVCACVNIYLPSVIAELCYLANLWDELVVVL